MCSIGEPAFYYVFLIFLFLGGLEGFLCLERKKQEHQGTEASLDHTLNAISVEIGKCALLGNDCLNLNLDINLHNQEVCSVGGSLRARTFSCVK